MNTFKADDRCCNCGRDYADHNYVENTLDQYRCPVQQYHSGYGGFYGGDPRLFSPGWEDATDEERENHRLACAAWDDAEAQGVTPKPEPCESGWQVIAGTNVHIFASQFGLGCYQIPIETFFEPLDAEREPWPWDEDDES